MHLVSAGQNILRNCIRSRIPGLFSRIECTNASAALAQESRDKDLPTLDRNPFEKERKQCVLCKYGIEPDYKNVRLLSQFQSRYTGRIYGRHITGLCKKKQERVEQEILKAQNAGFMGYMTKDVRYIHDPKLFDPTHPFRPHKY